MKKLLPILISIVFLSSCATAAIDSVATPTQFVGETHKVISTPEPTPEPELTQEDVSNLFFENNIFDFVSENYYAQEEGKKGYEIVTKDTQKAFKLADEYKQWVESAASTLPEDINVNISSLPMVKLLCILNYGYFDDETQLKNAFQNALLLNYEQNTKTFEVSAKNPREVFYTLPCTQSVTPFDLSLMYAYLATIFDDEFEFLKINPVENLAVEKFLFPIEPVKKYYFVDGWYNDRDGGNRRHTGTDINAPEGTALLACVDGTILDIGRSQGAGNYVVLLGKDGMQYHYYHMVEPSNATVGQEVKTGDQIGKVGNTGNSTANHLHFTMISPSGLYVNPYEHLKTAYDTLKSQQ